MGMENNKVSERESDSAGRIIKIKKQLETGFFAFFPLFFMDWIWKEMKAVKIWMEMDGEKFREVFATSSEESSWWKL